MTEKISEHTLATIVLISIEDTFQFATRPEWNRQLYMELLDQIRLSEIIEGRLERKMNGKHLWAFDISNLKTPAYVFAAYAGIFRLNQDYNPD